MPPQELIKMNSYDDFSKDYDGEIVILCIFLHSLNEEGDDVSTLDFNLDKVTSELGDLKPICDILLPLVTEFRISYKERLQEMSEDLLKQNGSPSIVPSLVLGVANDLFSQGISWGRIVALLAFTTELLHICMSHEDMPSYVTCRIIRYVNFYVKKSLSSWIRDHDGWDGLIDFSRKRDPLQDKPKTLVQNIFHGVLCAFGIFASASNVLNQITV